MRVARFATKHVVLPRAWRNGGKSGADASDRRPIHEDALLWQPENGGGVVSEPQRIQRLMCLMGIEAIYPKRRTTRPGAGHKIYPYLLRGVEITRPDQVWSTDITYIPLRHGFLYLVA